MTVLVSIIIPTFNRIQYFEKTIKSVLNQTFQNFEIIVVDDNPNSELIHQTMILEDKRVRYFKNTSNRGASFSRNFGAQKSNGQFIAFLDDDDLWLPNKLEKQISHFYKLNINFGVVYCGFEYLFKDKIIKKKNTYHKENDILNIALRRCPIGSPTALINKHFFLKAGGYDISFPSCQDWDLWIRLSKICKFSPVKEPLALYRIHGEQISSDIIKKINGRKKILKKHFKDISSSPHTLSWHYRRLGSLCSLTRNKRQAITHYKHSLRADKSNIGSWFHVFLLTLNGRLHRWFLDRYGITNINGIKIIT